jgi:hypothetical protein
MEVYRQGDVVIRKLAELAETYTDDVQEHQAILARGEVTGHAHRLTGGEWRCDGETLVVITYALLEHEEHSTIRLPSGVYEIFRQRELDPFNINEHEHWVND